MSRANPKKDDKKAELGKADAQKRDSNNPTKATPAATLQLNKTSGATVYAERQRLMAASTTKKDDTRVQDDTGNKPNDEEQGGVYKNGGQDDEGPSGCILS